MSHQLNLSSFQLLLLGFLLFVLNATILFFEAELALFIFTAIVVALVIWHLIVDLDRLMIFYAFLIPLSISVSLPSFKLSMPSEPIMMLVSLMIVYKILFNKGLNIRVLKHPITLILLIDLLWTFISCVYSTMPEISVKRLIIKSCYFLVFYYLLANNFSNIRKYFQLILAYALGMIIPILWTVYTHGQLDFDMRSSFMVTMPFYPEHTIYGAALAFLSTIFLVLNIKKFNAVKKRLLFVLLTFLLLALFLSFSRAAWLSMVIAIVLILLVKFKVKRHFIALGMIGLLTLAYINLDKIMAQFEETEAISSKGNLTEHVASLTNVTNDASNAERINRWASAWRMTMEKPLLGFGPGTYQFQYAPYQRIDQLTRISTFDGDKGNAHSEFLNTSSETGLPGMLITVMLFLTVLFYLRRTYFKSVGMIKTISLAVLMAFIGYFFHSFVNSFLDVDKIAILIYGAFAFATASDLSLVQLTSKRSE